MFPTSYIATTITAAAAVSILLFNLSTAHTSHQSTVGDLVDCLGNKTRFRIAQVGPGLSVTSTPYKFHPLTVEDYHDDAVSDCILALRMQGVVYQVVPLEDLYPIVSTREEDMEAVEVPDDFVPRSKTALDWYPYKEDEEEEDGSMGKRGNSRGATQHSC